MLLTMREAQEMLRLGRTKLYELIAAGELKPIRIGRAVRFPVTEVERFVRRLQEEAEAHGRAPDA